MGDSDVLEESADVVGGSEGIFDELKQELDKTSMPPPASPTKSGPHVMMLVVLVVLQCL